MYTLTINTRLYCISCGKKTLTTDGGDDYYEGLQYICATCGMTFSTKAYDVDDIREDDDKE